ncbi:hypothetical protein RB620_26190 [Paenibacillus sp. LHD-117]|nr:hypothetical protein [Paenibacillus sp. LHD-117]MDQ6422923.1 hypothetical protein [Paenibacillus sp. LHD-117]
MEQQLAIDPFGGKPRMRDWEEMAGGQIVRRESPEFVRDMPYAIFSAP